MRADLGAHIGLPPSTTSAPNSPTHTPPSRVTTSAPSALQASSAVASATTATTGVGASIPFTNICNNTNNSSTSTDDTSGFVVAGLFGVGLGYGLRATLDGSSSSEPDGSTGRADGVAVYLKRAATLVLASVVKAKDISRVYGTDITTGLAIESWEERIQAYTRAKKAKRRDERGESHSPTPLSLDERVRARH